MLVTSQESLGVKSVKRALKRLARTSQWTSLRAPSASARRWRKMAVILVLREWLFLRPREGPPLTLAPPREDVVTVEGRAGRLLSQA